MLSELVVGLALLFATAPATAQVSVGIGFPNVSIGINLSLFPELVLIPGYPVYYAPQVNSNYFFYDGMYWVFQGDSWYASSWYNGPWRPIGPEFVPVFLLQIPVGYYRQPPEYFRRWRSDAPPRWDEHWGHEWAQRRGGWDRQHRTSAPAPLPLYQRQYSGDRYPRIEQQRALQGENYRYQPHDPEVRRHYQTQQMQGSPTPPQYPTQGMPPERSPGQQDNRRFNPPPSAPQRAPIAPYSQPPQRGTQDTERSIPPQASPQRRGPPVQQQDPQPQREAPRYQQPDARTHSQEAGAQQRTAPPEPARGPRQGPGQSRDREQADDHGPDRNR